MDIVDAYVKILPKYWQIEVTLARAGTVRYKQARGTRGTTGVRAGGAAAEYCTGFCTGTCNKFYKRLYLATRILRDYFT